MLPRLPAPAKESPWLSRQVNECLTYFWVMLLSWTPQYLQTHTPRTQTQLLHSAAFVKRWQQLPEQLSQSLELLPFSQHLASPTVGCRMSTTNPQTKGPARWSHLKAQQNFPSGINNYLMVLKILLLASKVDKVGILCQERHLLFFPSGDVICTF